MADVKGVTKDEYGKGNSTLAGRVKRDRKTREEKGLPELTAGQKQVKAMIQQAQNACQFIKAEADKGTPIKAEILRACSVLAGSLAGSLGQE